MLTERNNIRDIIDRILAFIFLLISIPIFLILFILVRLASNGQFIFKQKRMGKNKKIFTMYKIRTMVENADELKKHYINLNEADGPVFKIKEDPRYTKLGKFLSYTGLDELPQLINVLNGDMALVGPRPLPVEEALQIIQKYPERFTVLPGITSTWILEGAHKLSFKQWMALDSAYVKNRSFLFDSYIMAKTIMLVCKLVLQKSLPGYFRRN